MHTEYTLQLWCCEWTISVNKWWVQRCVLVEVERNEQTDRRARDWMKNVNRETLSGADLILKSEIQALLAWYKIVTLYTTCIYYNHNNYKTKMVDDDNNII